MTAHIGGRLTVATVKAAGPGKYTDGLGLYLQVGPTGKKSWYLRYTLRGTTRDMGLGAYPTFGLADARERAAAARRQLADGIDPLAAREMKKAEKAPMPFAEAAERYIAAHEKGWSKDHDRQWRASLKNYVLPAIGPRPVAAIDTDDVLSVVEPLWRAGKVETGTRVLNRISLVLDWATARKLRSGDNPARWRGNLDAALPTRLKVQPEVHHAALDWREIPAFLARLRADPQPGARAAELLVLTACRTGEVRFAEWSEFDLEGSVWTIPAERMKAARPHRIPLSDAALGILRAMDRKGDHVFPRLGQHAILKAVQRAAPGVAAHGLRSSFRDWAAEQTNTPREIIEMALAHAVGDQVERAYQRSDLIERRRVLMERWAAFCDGTEDQKVVELRRAG